MAREEELWAKEVARVLADAQTFTPAARAMLQQVLASLATDPDSQHDARAMLAALSHRGRTRLTEVA